MCSLAEPGMAQEEEERMLDGVLLLVVLVLGTAVLRLVAFPHLFAEGAWFLRDQGALDFPRSPRPGGLGHRHHAPGDFNGRVRWGILERVGEQIGQNLLEAYRLAPDRNTTG